MGSMGLMGVGVGSAGEVRVGSVAELLAMVEKIERASRAEVCAGVTPGAEVGTRLCVDGPWSPGQVLQHLAIAVERSIEPGGVGGRFGHDSPELTPDAQVWTEVGADRLRRALARIDRGERMCRGGMGHEEWLEWHLRHAGEHLASVRVSEAG